MNWFKNLKISLKLYIGFGSVILMMILLVGISVYNITKTSADYDWVLAFPASRFEQSSNIKADFIEVRRTVLAIAFYSDDNSTVEKNYTDTKASIVVINKNLDDYRSSVQSDPKLSDADKSTRMTNVDNLKSKINNEYMPLVTVIYNSAKADDETALMQSVSDIGVVASDIRDIVDSMSEVATTRMAAETQTTSANADRQALLLIILSGIIVLFAASFSLVIGKSIRVPIVNIENAVRDISEGNLNVQIRSNSRDEIGVLSNSVGNVVDVFKNIVAEISNMYKGFELGNIDSEIPVDSFKGDYQQVVVAVNKLKKGLIADTLNFANAMGEVANGNFDANLDKLPGGRALLNEILDNMQKNMQSINKDITYLIKSASMGELSAKVDASIYRGGWAEIINGLNELMKAIVAPIREVDAVLQQVSVGNFDNKVTGDYKGDFLLMKNSLNSTITNIASYIDEISAVLGGISRNDLDQRVTREYVGKFSDIKDALNNILNTLNDVIGDITSAAEQVNAGARAISESSMTLATGATEQASSVEELNATVLTINEGTQKNAKSALEAKELSDSCKSSADKGDRDMNNMLASMRSINDSSNSISKIIKVIDDIAFQTNLLALNAAVEAARAGTHGKGFAVVAEEVRTLAGRSQNAAKETADLIEESIARVNEGTKIADDTANTLRAIVNDVTKVADIITDIAEASNEQAYGIKQVTDGITQIAEVVQDNSATSEESASASQQLSSQAEVMRSLVAEFKLRR